MNIVVDNLLIRYDLTGKGKLVLLLHGWGDSGAGLHDLQKQLAKDYQVLVLDLPGFGASQAPADVWNLDNYAECVAHTLHKLKLDNLYAVIGHSNGGALAIRALSLSLLKPKKLVLLAASGIRTGNSAKRVILKIIAKTGNLATIWMPPRYRQALRKSLYGAAGSDMLVVPQLQETFKKTVRQDVQTDAVRIKIPTLLIYGDSDRAVPLTDGQKYNELIEGSKLEVLKDTGHFVHTEKPEETLKLIEEFLR